MSGFLSTLIANSLGYEVCDSITSGASVLNIPLTISASEYDIECKLTNALKGGYVKGMDADDNPVFRIASNSNGSAFQSYYKSNGQGYRAYTTGGGYTSYPSVTFKQNIGNGYAFSATSNDGTDIASALTTTTNTLGEGTVVNIVVNESQVAGMVYSYINIGDINLVPIKRSDGYCGFMDLTSGSVFVDETGSWQC